MACPHNTLVSSHVSHFFKTLPRVCTHCSHISPALPWGLRGCHLRSDVPWPHFLIEWKRTFSILPSVRTVTRPKDRHSIRREITRMANPSNSALLQRRGGRRPRHPMTPKPP